MPGPWEKYQSNSETEEGPWTKYKSEDDESINSFPKMKREDLNKIFSANKKNKDMQGGANAPALVKARQDVAKKTSNSQNADIPIATQKAFYNATWPFSAIAQRALGNKGGTSEPDTSAGKALADFGSLANPALQEGLILGGKAIKTVSKFIPDTIKRGAADYLTNDIAPKVHQIFQDAVAKFTPEIENFARKLKVPESAIYTMKKYGTQAVEKSKGSQDAIAQRIKQGLESKDKEVEDAYKSATSVFEKNKGIIHLTGTKRAMGSLLRRAGYINDSNKETELATNDISENSPLRKILGFYKSIGANQEWKITGVNTLQWNMFRNQLSKLRGSDKSLSGSIKGILDSLHSDGEKAGLKGIQQARTLAARNFSAEDKFNNANGAVKSLMQEKGIGKYHTMSGDQKRSVQDLGNYIGDKNLTGDVEKASASQYLDKIQDGKSLEDFQTLLNKAADKKWTVHSKVKLEELVGKNNAKKIIDEVIAHRQANAVKKGVGIGTGLLVGEEAYRRGRQLIP